LTIQARQFAYYSFSTNLQPNIISFINHFFILFYQKFTTNRPRFSILILRNILDIYFILLRSDFSHTPNALRYVQFIEKKIPTARSNSTSGWKHWERKKINIINQRLKKINIDAKTCNKECFKISKSHQLRKLA
jgi:hypothetical protein